MTASKLPPTLAQILKALGDAIVEAVSVAPLGAPGGTIYAVLMTHGCTLEVFEQIMDALVASGRLERRGDLYFVKGAKHVKHSILPTQHPR